MARRQAERLRPLTAEEQATLVNVARASSERVDWVRRAGLRSDTTVAGLVGRFNRRGVAALSIAAGRGRKPTYDAAARARIVATAQRPPERRRDGTATWSLST